MKQSKLVNLLLLAALVCISLYQYSTKNAGSHEPERMMETTPGKIDDAFTKGKSQNGEFPDYVISTLEHIRKTGKAPEGYVGGRRFQNREKRLPKKESNGKKINYREWDVHRKIKGKNRGAERLVTGSDDSAYYTKDHYKTFKKIN